MAVAMDSLVSAGVVAQVGARAIAGHSATRDTRDGWSVVRDVSESGVANVVGGGHERGLPKEAGVF